MDCALGLEGPALSTLVSSKEGVAWAPRLEGLALSTLMSPQISLLSPITESKGKISFLELQALSQDALEE